jgi:DMSO/TMAO reductase YedYZ molybdopterin-dependent catalytic subunit
MSAVKKVLIVLAILLTVISIASLISGRLPGSSPGVIPLDSVEVRAYQGEQLSSVNDFYENSIRGPQFVNESDYRLTISGLTNKTAVYTYRDIRDGYQSYSKVVTLECVEGWDAKILWEGVLVRDLLMDAGIDPRAKIVIFTAHDGYTTSFPLDYVMNQDILMAYRMNNITIPAERGFPFQLVAEDKWGYKWIKWIEKIELSDDTAYRGYWEKRGYSNTGNLNKSFFSE